MGEIKIVYFEDFDGSFNYKLVIPRSYIVKVKYPRLTIAWWLFKILWKEWRKEDVRRYNIHKREK